MRIQYVSTYISLAQEGLVPSLACPVDQGPLMCNEDKEENIFLYCLECDYKRIMGLGLYSRLKKAVDNVQQ